MKGMAIMITALAIIGAAAAGTLGYMAVTGSQQESDIVDTAVQAGSFNTLAAALQEAGLVEALKSEGPFTVFAPTDEAFAKLPDGTVESLLNDREALTEVLTYHVVSGKVMSSDLPGVESAGTLQGGMVYFDTSDGVMVNDASVIQADIMASNGVIHVIDTVLIPGS